MIEHDRLGIPLAGTRPLPHADQAPQMLRAELEDGNLTGPIADHEPRRKGRTAATSRVWTSEPSALGYLGELAELARRIERAATARQTAIVREAYRRQRRMEEPAGVFPGGHGSARTEMSAEPPIPVDDRDPVRLNDFSTYRREDCEASGAVEGSSPQSPQALVPRGDKLRILEADADGDGRHAVDLDAQPIAAWPGTEGRRELISFANARPEGADPEPDLFLVASEILAQQMSCASHWHPAQMHGRTLDPHGQHRVLNGVIQAARPLAIHNPSHQHAARQMEILTPARSRSRGTSLSVGNRAAAFSFGVPGSGLFYRFEFSSSRIQTYGPARGGRRFSAAPVLLAMVAVGVLMFWGLSSRGGSREVAYMEPAQAAAPIPVKPAAPPAPPQEQPVQKTQPTAAAQEQPTPAPAPAATRVQEQVATSRPATIRARPDERSQVLRSVPHKVIMTVFEKKNDWLQVGSTYPWGWIHSSSVYGYGPHIEASTTSAAAR
jgi:hypothetical protein